MHDRRQLWHRTHQLHPFDHIGHDALLRSLLSRVMMLMHLLRTTKSTSHIED
jgi:hypothetical protein